MVIAAAFDVQLTDFLNQVGTIVFYLAVWALVFSGTGLFVGVFIPFITGDSLLFAAGLVAAAASDKVNIIILALGVGIAAFLGDQLGFILGRHLGRPYLDKKTGPRMKKMVVRTEAFYTKYGWWSVVVARFIPWGRVFVPWIAGIGKMDYFKFLTSNFVGALAWGVGLTVVGYFAASIPQVKVAAYIIGGFFIAASLFFGIRTWIADRRERKAESTGSSK